MDKGMKEKLKRSILLHEGWKNFPYVDTVGKITIGCGYNLTDRGMDDDWINSQYERDVCYFYNQLNQFPWFLNMNIDRQIVLVDMCFMGWKHFLTFRRMMTCLANYDYLNASKEMLNSKWAIQCPERAKQLAHAMLTGSYEI